METRDEKLEELVSVARDNGGRAARMPSLEDQEDYLRAVSGVNKRHAHGWGQVYVWDVSKVTESLNEETWSAFRTASV